MSNERNTMAFEIFYLSELLAENIISQELFDKAYEKLNKELSFDKDKEMELEL